MKTAVIFYSFEGNCALAAKAVKDALNADIFEIKTKNKKKPSGFIKYLWGGFQVVTRKKPELEPLSIDVNTYDLLILGTPVWAASPTPAIFSFLSKTELTGKKIALFCCHAGGKGKIFDKLRALLPGNTFVGEIDFKNPAGGESAGLNQAIGEWAKKIKETTGA